MEDEKDWSTPLGLMFVTVGEVHEQLSFTYPFTCGFIGVHPDANFHVPEYSAQFISDSDREEVEQYGVPTKILAHLLSAKGMCDTPFEIKIDNFRFAGFPKLVTAPAGRSPLIFHVVFVLTANAPAHLVNSFQNLSRKIALALDEEQCRCDYLADQMTTMLNIHEKNDTLPSGSDNAPYCEILEHCTLAQHLKDIFDDLCDYGTVQVFINECIEVGFCIETRAYVYAGLTPRSRADVEMMISRIQPYHGIILLEETVPSPDTNPSVRRLIRHCEPYRSILDISGASGLPMVQVLLVIRHLLLWARALIIYPLCSSNVYTSAAPPKPISRYTEQFSELFGNVQLPAILAQFSPPCTLADFVNTALHDAEEQNRRIHMVARLLRDELVMQLHTFIYLLPPFSKECQKMFDSTRVRDERIREVIKTANVTAEIKAALALVCDSLLQHSSPDQIETLLCQFLRFLPYLNGEHHIEDLIYRMNLERSVVIRVLDTFASLLAPFSRADYIKG